MGNGEAKELICTTHGHELSKGRMLVGGGYRVEGNKGGKWGNCNSIINKMYFLKVFGQQLFVSDFLSIGMKVIKKEKKSKRIYLYCWNVSLIIMI